MLSILIVNSIKLVDKIPLSRFTREMKKWIRYVEKNPNSVIHITRNKLDFGVFMSPEKYDGINQNVLS